MATTRPSIPSGQLELAQHLLREMERIRLVEEAIADRYPEQQMRCPVHLSIGQEAVPVCIAASLGPADTVASNHRGHGHALAMRVEAANTSAWPAGMNRGRLPSR